MKKMKKWLLVLLMMVGLVQGKTVFAANDSFTTASNIQVNKTVTDRMAYTNQTDYNYYKFTLPADGYISMSFSHAELESTSTMWDITIYNAERTGIKTISSQGSEKNVTSNNIGLPAGTYYVCVDNEWKTKSTINYQLLLKYVTANNWETEFNDGFLQADALTLNRLMNGSMMYSGSTDYDYYKFTLLAAGYISMSFSHVELESTNTMWDITIYNAERTGIGTINSRGSDKNVTSCNIGLPAGTYYVCVDNEWKTKSTIDYQLLIKYVQTNNWETEFNGGFLQADTLTINQAMNGSMRSSEYDYYKFDVPTKGYIDVKFTHAKLESANEMWDVTLYDVNRNFLKTMSVEGNRTSVNLGKMYLSKGSYYILIDNKWRTVSTIDYTVKAYYTTPKAEIKKVTLQNKKLTLQWKTLKGVSGYQIDTATDKKFKKNKKTMQISGKNESKTAIKKLKSKKKYYVRMRGYITVKGKQYYGAWSKVKTVTAK